MDAGFFDVVKKRQYFMTKDTAEFSQFTDAVTCREYTLSRDEEAADPKGCIRGNLKIGPLLEVTTCYLQEKHGVETRIMSVNACTSHFCVRISHDFKTNWSRIRRTTSRKPQYHSSKNIR